VPSSTKSPKQSYRDLASADEKGRRNLKASAATIAPPARQADRADSDDLSDPELKPKPARFVHRAEVLNRVGISYTALWLWVRDGKFPAPYELGGGHQRARLAWLESDVDKWFAERTKRFPKGSKARSAEVA
jgi:predicted DNA-binding transcriptional regulator AlpA